MLLLHLELLQSVASFRDARELRGAAAAGSGAGAGSGSGGMSASGASGDFEAELLDSLPYTCASLVRHQVANDGAQAALGRLASAPHSSGRAIGAPSPIWSAPA